MESIARKLRRKIVGTLYLDLGGGPEDAILLGGSGRSGTTWLSQVLNFDDRYRYLFEPFDPRYVPAWKGFAERTYRRPSEEHPEALEMTRRVLSGGIRNRWVDNHNTRLLGRRRLVKDVRGNLFLKWLSVHFPEVPIAFALRHPCAVALSQEGGQILRGSWPPGLESLLDQPALVEDHLEPFVPQIREACSMELFEQLIFRWCIENYVPLRQFAAGEIHWICYERACLDPEVEIRALFDFFGRPWDDRVLGAARLPSAMTGPDSGIVSGQGLIDGWQQKVTPERAERVVQILQIFGLDGLYGTGVEPGSIPTPSDLGA